MKNGCEINMGIDIGGTNIAAGIADTNGNMLRKIVIPTVKERGYEEVICDIARVMNELQKGFESKILQNAGVAIPGAAHEDGRIVKCVNLGWKGQNIANDIKKLTGIDCTIENDSNAAIVGEYLFGAARGLKSAVMLTLGTGVGSGIIMEGRLMKGHNGAAAELGHMVVGENFYSCACGKNGCLETFASATALVRSFKRLVTTLDEYSLAIDIAGGNMELVQANEIVQAAKHGDTISMMAVVRMCRYLSTAIVNIINTIDPQAVIIGGGVSAAGDFIMEMIRKNVAEAIFYKELSHADIITAGLGADAGIIGAAFIGDFLKAGLNGLG